MTTASGSGHPTSALSIAHIVVALMYDQMRHDPQDPWNPNNDRLVLSEGHAVPIVYAAYADLGGAVGKDRASARPLTLSELTELREQDSVLDGHPNPAEGFPFFDAATGSLGQGLSVAAGLAAAARLDGIDKKIYTIIGDGESREGQIWEAMDFIIDQQLNKVCAFFNANQQGQAGYVSNQQSAEVLVDKARAFGWEARLIDGHDPTEILEAVSDVGRQDKPVAIVARTIKGWGVPMLQSGNFHGKPLSDDQMSLALAELDETGSQLGGDSDGAHALTPDKPAAATRAQPESVALPPFEEAVRRSHHAGGLDKKALATRVAYGIALTELGNVHEGVVALDGDVSNSTFSEIFGADHPRRFFECKIGEQNMISAGVGFSAAGKVPFASTFAKFLARGYDQIDLASIGRANLKVVGSHAGVSLAADGPSQMSLSDMAFFRSMTRVDVGTYRPGCVLFHPSDAVCAYRCVELMANHYGLCYLRTHRPAAPFLYDFDEKFEIGVVKQLAEGHGLTIVASGYMVTVAQRAIEVLKQKGIECNLFDAWCFPLECHSILAAAGRGNHVILTLEDNYIGGLHSELAEAAALEGAIRVVGMTCSRMPKSARSSDEVFAYTGVCVADVVQQAEKLV